MTSTSTLSTNDVPPVLNDVESLRGEIEQLHQMQLLNNRG